MFTKKASLRHLYNNLNNNLNARKVIKNLNNSLSLFNFITKIFQRSLNDNIEKYIAILSIYSESNK